jgi:uncharacterized protein (TIGR00730 family)
MKTALSEPVGGPARERALGRVCVYAGSRPGARHSYLTAAAALGRTLAEHGIGVVYGGGKTGLMGAMADAAMDAGGKVIGVMPQMLVEKEIAHTRIEDFRITDGMHERKKMMVDISDAFIALPGGFGTFDELFEVLTWAQIGLHDRPIGLLDVDGYFEPLVALASHVTAEGFAAKEHRELFVVESDPKTLVAKLRGFAPPPIVDAMLDRRGKK